jgi:hypothetical protein
MKDINLPADNVEYGKQQQGLKSRELISFWIFDILCRQDQCAGEIRKKYNRISY